MRSGPAQGFFHHRGHRGHKDFWWEGADSRSVGMARCRGWYRIFSPQRHRGHRDFYGGRARIRGQWEWRFVGVGTGLFSPQRHRGHRDFLWWGGADWSEVSGNGAMLGLVGVFFHHRGTEGTEIFYGGVARIRGQWEWRFVGGGTGFFSPQRHRGHRDFLWWGGVGFEVSLEWRDVGVGRGTGFFHHRGTEGT